MPQSSILGFLELWSRKAEEAEMLYLSHLNIFEANFIAAAAQDLSSELLTIGVELTINIDRHTLHLHGPSPQLLIDAVEAELADRPPPSLLTEVSQRVVESCARVLLEACPQLSGLSEELARLRCQTGQISGEEWMAAYEVLRAKVRVRVTVRTRRRLWDC